MFLPLPSRKQLQISCLVAIGLNILFYILIKSDSQFRIGGAESGNDSEYYHAYAIGLVDNAVNIWPVFLRFLNDANLYSREWISILLFLLHLVFAVVFPRLAFIGLQSTNLNDKRIKTLRWFFTLLLLLYPTSFLFSLDLYRDLPMLSLVAIAFVFGFLLILPGKLLSKLLLFFCFVSLCSLLYAFRPYLGLSVFFALLFYWKPDRSHIYAMSFSYILALLALRAAGLLDPILLYRGFEGFQGGGSSFGIGLQNVSALAFPFLVGLNILYQIFGLYFVSPQALVVFIVESIPFILAIRFVCASRAFMDRPSLYLFYFIIIYSSFVAIGNDNLGTALRLRVYTYVFTGLLSLRLAALRLHLRL